MRKSGAILKHGKISGKHKAFDPASVYYDPAGFKYCFRHFENMLPETAAYLRCFLC